MTPDTQYKILPYFVGLVGEAFNIENPDPNEAFLVRLEDVLTIIRSVFRTPANTAPITMVREDGIFVEEIGMFAERWPNETAG